jgi:hypothetical protein
VAILAILAFALGIGVTTAVFSIFSGVLLSPLPFPDPEQLVSVYGTQPACATCPASFPDRFTSSCASLHAAEPLERLSARPEDEGPHEQHRREDYGRPGNRPPHAAPTADLIRHVEQTRKRNGQVRKAQRRWVTVSQPFRIKVLEPWIRPNVRSA